MLFCFRIQPSGFLFILCNMVLSMGNPGRPAGVTRRREISPSPEPTLESTLKGLNLSAVPM